MKLTPARREKAIKKLVQSVRDEIGFKKVLHSEKSDLPYNSTLGIGGWGGDNKFQKILSSNNFLSKFCK